MDVQASCFQGRCESHMGHFSDSQVLKSGDTVKVGHGRFDTGSITVLIFEFSSLFIFAPSGQA